jgi:hypothetical protein
MWLQTQYALFGTKWSKLFSGPMWAHEPIMQAEGHSEINSLNPLHPTNALVNVPALSKRTLRRDIEKNAVSTGPEIQIHILKKAAECNPNALWWVKGDGVDVVKGLGESARGQWSGDADLNDGRLNSLYREYKLRLANAEAIGLRERGTQHFIEEDLNGALQVVIDGLSFLHSCKS